MMHFPMQKLRGYFSNLFVKLGLLILFLLAVFGYTQGRFIFVQAVADELNIYPGNYAAEGGENEFTWQNTDNTFTQDLGSNAQFGEFNIDNSAFISLRTFEEIAPASAEATAGKNNDGGEESAETDGEDGADTSETDEGSGDETVGESAPDETPDDEVGDSDNTDATSEEESGTVEVIDLSEIPADTLITNYEGGETSNNNGGGNETPPAESASESASEPAPEVPAAESTPTGDSGGETSRIWNRIKSLAVYLDFFRSKLVWAQESLENFIEGSEEEAGSVPLATDNNFIAELDFIKQSLIFSDFFVPAEYHDNDIKDLKLRVSLAARSDFIDDYIRLEYRTENGWRLLGEINALSDVSNSLNSDYFAFSLPATVGWDEIKDLSVRVSYINTNPPEARAGKTLEIYLDALWIEIGQENAISDEELELNPDEEDASTTEEELPEILPADLRDDFELITLTPKNDFKNNEKPQFKFRFKKKRNLLEGLGAGFLDVFRDEYKDISIRAEAVNGRGQTESEIELTVNYLSDGEFAVNIIKQSRQFKPGKFNIKISIASDSLTVGRTVDFSQDFTWGVLALNTNKSIYESGENAYLQIAVLDDLGDTLCAVDFIELEIKAPDGGIAYLRDTNDLIISNPECGPNNVITSPDFYAYYGVGPLGAYEMTLRVQTENGEREITDVFEVRAPDEAIFSVERIGPTRIYPKADYDMGFRIIPQADFRGNFVEVVPANFKITEQKRNGALIPILVRDKTNAQTGEMEQEIIWKVDWRAGREYVLSYTFDAPNISPEFFLLGPARLYGKIAIWDETGVREELTDFTEIRQWQIASDALSIIYTKQTAGVEIDGTDYDIINSITGFSESEYVLFGGVGNITADGGTTRIETSLATADGSGLLTETDEENEGPNADDRWAYFAMTKRIMSSSDTIYLHGYDYTGSGEADESFLMGMDMSTMGTESIDYFWDNDAVVDGTILTTIAGENNRASITFTPDGVSQYLIIASARIDAQVESEIGEMAIWNGSASIVNHIRDNEDTADEPLLFAATTTIPAAVSTTYSVRVRGETNNSIDYLSSSILVIRLNYYENFSCDAKANAGNVGTSPTIMASTDLQLSEAGDVTVLYFGGFSSPAQDSEVSFRARQDASIRFQLTEGDTGNEPGRNAVWDTGDVHNLLWLDNISGVNTNSHAYDLAMEASAVGPTAPWAMVCAWSEAEYVPPPDVNVSATGTQVSTIDINSQDNYVGGKFVLTNSSSTAITVNSINIVELGTVNASTSLENIRLYYDLDTTLPYDCTSTSYDLSDLQFGATSTAFSDTNGTSTFSGSVNISATSSMCVYVVLDVNSNADKDETLEVEINNPSTDVGLSAGARVGPVTSVELSGTTVLYAPDVMATAYEQRKSDNFTDIANQGWTNENQVNLYALAQAMGGATTTYYDFYFELLDESGTYTTATSAPGSPCLENVIYDNCANKVWLASSTLPGWYNGSWLYRKKITINAAQVVANETGFPVMATTTDSDFAHTSFGGKMASSSAADIVITDSDGLTVLNYEREYYAPATGQIALWIKTDISSTTNKELYIYYGNAGISADQSTTTGVWDDNYMGVWHMNNNPAGTAPQLRDSTKNAHHATANGAWNIGDLVSTPMGQGIDSPGVNNQEFQIANSGNWLNGLTNMSVEIWLDSNVINADMGIITCDEASEDSSYVMMRYDTSGWAGGGDDVIKVINQYESASYVQSANRQYLGYSWTASHDIDFYVNGSIDTPTSDGGSSFTSISGCNTFLIGDGGNVPSGNWNGIIDEFRISSTTRSAARFRTQNNNYGNVNNFLTFGNEESSSQIITEGVVNLTAIPDRGSSTDPTKGYKWQVLACDDKGSCSNWDAFNSTLPNFKVDTAAPDAPGSLTLATSTATSITVEFHNETTEPNFAYYKIFYKAGFSGVDTDDTEHDDPDLDHIDYNNTSTTTITGLIPETQYVINIWAYDLAGNKTGATEITVTTPSAPHARARSVLFHAGDYSGDGSTGQDTNTDQVFDTFNFELAETGAEIKNAYILFETHFEAYNTTAGDYSGYNLSFDACSEPCTADAGSGSGRILVDSNSVLSYDETAGKQARLLADVTEEVQLSAYTGSGADMEAQIGYRLETDVTGPSIAYARAVLVVTYSYDDDNSTNLTNTVIYPLESTASGDQGSKLAVQADDCTKSPLPSSNCALFDYNMVIPEVSAKLSQWFELYGVNDGHGASDVAINANIEGSNVDSDTYYHESVLAGTQGNFPRVIIDNVTGYSENIAQVFEYALTSPGGGQYYALGGEVIETYTAPRSAGTKTRTVSFPIGLVFDNRGSMSASAQVYFPENGSGSGVVDIKKAWFRLIGDNYNTGAYGLAVSSKVGNNSVTATSTYALNAGATVIRPSYNIVHVIPSADYSELEAANATAPKEVTVNATTTAVSSPDMGAVSAELMITYTYTGETSGYLTSLNLFGGQSDQHGASQADTETAADAVFPELRGEETLRAAALLGSFSLSASDGTMPGTWFYMDANIATGTPACSTSTGYMARDDAVNGYAEFYQDVFSAMSTDDDESYSVCYANDNAADTNAGARMNAVWLYTYQWDAPPPAFTQSDWRWYNNADSIAPGTARAAEKTSITGVNIGEAIRLRVNIGITSEDLAAMTSAFKLQYGKASDCASLGESDWTDLGGVAGSEAWRGYNNPDPGDGTTLSAAVLSSSDVAESYEESNNSASNPRAIDIGEYGEWDWVVYNNAASSSADYCFRMVESDGTVLNDYLSDSYPKLTTAPANTAAASASNLAQYRNNGTTAIANNSWVNENTVKLRAAATDPNISERIALYYEIASSSSGSFTTATTSPASWCYAGTAWGSCPSRIWAATSSLGDYRTSPFTATATIPGLPESSEGYKWQVLACDDDGACADTWTKYNLTIPNFKIDTVAPTPPGNLTFASSTATMISLTFGASTTEANFDRYRIYYRAGVAGVTESDSQHTDNAALLFKNYGGYGTTTVFNLSAGTNYVFNIWAYDLAGNKATATIEATGATDPSFTPPLGYFTIGGSAERTNGSGVVDITIQVDDPDNDDTVRAKIMYKSGAVCSSGMFSEGYSDPTLDATDANISATYGDPDIDNAYPYQVGTTSSFILTSGAGDNFVLFDWLSMTDLAGVEGDYCLGLVVNDGMYDQLATNTIAVEIDNKLPAVPGYLRLESKHYDSIELRFGTTSADTHFTEYKVFYKEGTAGVTEADTVFDKTDDPDLDDVNFGGTSTTTITGLNPNTTYVFNILAYDSYGNKATATTELTVKTNARPTNISADGQYLDDGVTPIVNGSWIDENNVIFRASAHDQDAADLVTFYYQLITATGTYLSSLTPPGNTCVYGTTFLACDSKVWAVSTSTSDLPADWYDSNWLYRKKITINASQVPANASDFPILATTTDANLAGKARSDGYDIIFTAADGTTPLDYEREYYNGATGQLAVWIETDLSSTTDTELYMYYGNSGANIDPATTTGVWDSSYRGVWHLEENVVDEGSSADAHEDSCSYANNADQYGNNEYSSWIYRGQDFDGLNDYISVPDHSSLDLSDALSVEFWIEGAASEQTATKTVYSAAGNDTFTVPPGVTAVTLKSWGAGGGGGGGSATGGVPNTRNGGGPGGGGAFVQGTLSVEPGQILDITVGGGGTAGTLVTTSGQGGGGGGRSSVYRSGTPLVIAAAGGGGGGGTNDEAAQGETGGAGGAIQGEDGGDTNGSVGGGGGTQSAGGTAGTGTNTGTAGGSLTGGAGADGRNNQGADGSGPAGGFGGGAAGGQGDAAGTYPAGGGGGAGYYGGGGGGEAAGSLNGGAGGGGGSSFVSASVTATTTTGGSGYTPANTGDSDYESNTGAGGDGGAAGGSGANGGSGLVVVSYTPAVTIVGKGNDAYQISLDGDMNIFAQINSQPVSTQIVPGWHHIVMTYDRSAGGTDELKLYVDGVLRDTADFSSVVNTNNSVVKIGELFDGLVDELRISGIARSSGWIQTAYNNQRGVANFLSFGTEGTVQSFYESTLVITVPDNPDYSSGYKWQVMACDDDLDCSAWEQFNVTTPNFKIDTTDPSSPGQLIEASKTSNSVTLNFGAATDEDNFTEYRIFYSTSSPVTEADYEHNDTDLDFKNYNGTSGVTISSLNPSTTYYFNIWAYDIVGHKASSTVTTVILEAAVSTPGAIFYTKNDQAIYYQVWDGAGWGVEQSSGNLTAAGDNIRHIRTIRSDDGGKVGILFKTWDGTNQEWWGAVYRFGADDFVNYEILGTAEADATNNQIITGCLTSLSGGEFVVVRNDNTSAGARAFSWNPAGGWTDEGVIPGTTGSGKMDVMNGCEFVRRPGTDNYLLMTFDNLADVGSMYYYGGATFDNSSGAWTAWVEHSDVEEDTANYVGQAYFDPSDNTRGALYYSDSNSVFYALAKYFSVTDTTINYGGAVLSPTTGTEDWNDDFVHGEFAVNPGSTGIAYFIGRDITEELNVYKVDSSNPTIAWATSTNGDNISGGNLFDDGNYSQKPFAINFYKNDKGVAAGVYNTSPTAPFYSVINASTNVLSSVSSIEGATNDLWTRIRFYDDPNEDEFLAVIQNNNVDYAAVFWDSGNERFYNSGSQAWGVRAAGTGAASSNFECTSYAYTKYNSGPNQPTGLYQATSTFPAANQSWMATSTIKFTASAADYDTSEIITLYLQLVPTNDTFTTSTDESTFNACAIGTSWTACNSKIWTMETSGAGDYSYTPYTATATISSIASSTTGYKWQVIACDDESECSIWKAYNATTPNFYVDTEAPSAPGALNPTARTSSSVTLNFGAQTDEPAVSFSRYRIFYATSTPVFEIYEWTDTDLNFRNYNGTTNTVVTGLASNTLYYFNIWAYDKAGNSASSTIVATTTSMNANLVQTSFILENDDGSTVNNNTAEVAASTTLTGLNIGERLNARIQVENNGGDISSGKTYKLQFENYSGNPGVWNDVGAATSVSFAFGLSGANGDAVVPDKASPNGLTPKYGTWHENTNTTAAFTLSNGEYTEFVFAVHVGYAATSTTYRLRLYNATDNKPLDSYNNYPMFSTVTTETKRYSKGFYASLPATAADLTYFLDPEGYADVLTDDSNYDPATSTAQYPIFLFATKHTNNTNAASSTWNGQSSVAPSGSNVVLQVFRVSTAAWVTVDTETAAGANTDFTLTGAVNSSVSDYYAAGDWIYWRVYQVSGSESLRTDRYVANFAPPAADTAQIHYRWRQDDGSETTATWLEAEDTGSATLGPQLGRGSSTRIRIAVTNTGGGTATDYYYRLEYASSTDGCATDPAYWAAVPIAAGSDHFEMAPSGNFSNNFPTTAQTANTEGYTFIAGEMIKDPLALTGEIDLSENQYTELEYMIQVTNNAPDAATYCFRVTNNGAVLNSYDIYPIVTLSGNTNNAPHFTTDPADGGSSAADPTDYGDNVDFTAIAADDDGDSYYLAVCRTAAVSPGLDGAPSCPGGAWCVSGQTASNGNASCSYTTATTTETNAWYAYACDKVPGFGIARCSAVSQGSGDPDEDSPFIINNPPVFTSVVTTVNNQDPGGTFWITAYATDTDTAGSADTLRLRVCTTNNGAFGGCIDGAYCSELASSSPNTSCSFATSTPAPAGNWNYYAFVYDSHGLAAAANSRSGTYTVNNTAPTIGTFYLNDGDDIQLNLKDDADTVISTIGGSIQDLNGCTDLDSVIGTIYMSEEENTCDDDPNNCYQIPYNTGMTTTCTIACDPTDLTRASTTCTAEFKYFAVPTDDVYESNPWKDYNWLSYILLNDGVNLAASTSQGVELGTNLALDVVESTIDFGTWGAGQNTGMNNSTTTVENAGNSPIDVEVYGTTMFSNPPAGYDIAVNQIKFNNVNFNYVFETNTLDTVANPKPIELFAPRATTTAGSMDDVYWGIGIPFLAVPANYIGENTFTVWIDEDDWN